jgi:hypothetical protein
MVERPPPYLIAKIPRCQTSEIQFTIETDEDTRKPAMKILPACVLFRRWILMSSYLGIFPAGKRWNQSSEWTGED